MLPRRDLWSKEVIGKESPRRIRIAADEVSEVEKLRYLMKIHSAIFFLFVDKTFGEIAVGVNSSISKEWPVATNIFLFAEITGGHDDFF